MEPEGSLPCSQEHSTGPHPEPDRSSPYHSIVSVLTLSTHIRLGLPSGLFPSGFFYQYPICVPLLPHSCYMPYPSHPPWLDYSNYTWRRVQVMKYLIMQFSSTSHHFISLRYKYSPQHLDLKHPQSMFLPKCHRPSFTPIQNHCYTTVMFSSSCRCNLILNITSSTPEGFLNPIQINWRSI
jgi:hypothetical protein